MVAVSDEVGSGIVPATASGRRFRDALGELNQRLAAAADEVWLVTAGIPRQAAMNSRLARSISMFTIVPVRVAVDLQPGDGAGALLWLPAVGAFAGAAAALPASAIREWAPHANLLGAVLAVARSRC